MERVAAAAELTGTHAEGGVAQRLREHHKGARLSRRFCALRHCAELDRKGLDVEARGFADERPCACAAIVPMMLKMVVMYNMKCPAAGTRTSRGVRTPSLKFQTSGEPGWT